MRRLVCCPRKIWVHHEAGPGILQHWQGILGGHPDCTGAVCGGQHRVFGSRDAYSTWSGSGIEDQAMPNKVFCLVGDGECHEGTIWEGANVAANMNLGNFCVIVDWNQSAAQLMPKDDLTGKWRAFGWDVHEIDGHSTSELKSTLKKIRHSSGDVPQAVIAHTVKGKEFPLSKDMDAGTTGFPVRMK